MQDFCRNNYRPLLGALLWALLVLTLNTACAQAQIGRYVVLMPTHISSGKYAGDYDIKGSMIEGDGLVAWGSVSPKSLCEMPVREFWPSAVPDELGGIILAYTIEHTDSGNFGDRDIVIRHFDSEGNDKWNNPETGAVLLLAQSSQFEEHPAIVKVNDGVIVFYEVRYADSDHSGDVDVAAIHVAPDGTLRWGEASWIANTDNFERIAGVCSDGKGNALVLIESGQNAKDTTNRNRSLSLYRITSDGTMGWEEGIGKEITIAGSSHDERNGVIAPDGTGGAYIAYEVFYTSGGRKGDVDIIAQHVSADGTRSWIDPNAPAVVSSNARAIERSPSITADSLGIVVSFEMDFQADSGTTTNRNRPLKMVGAQRLDKAGKAQWNNGERAQVILAKNRVVNRPQTFADKSGGTYILMEGLDTLTGDRDIYIQKLDEKGERLWGEKGYAIPVFNGPMPEERASAFPDNYGGLVVVAVQPPKYRVSTSTSNDSTIVAQRLNDLGKAVWGDPESNLLVARCELGDYGPTVVQSK